MKNIKLNEDVTKGENDTLSGVTVNSGNVNIDLNGNNINASSGSSAAITVANGGTLTLDNTVDNGGNVVGADGYRVVEVNGGSLTLDGNTNITHNAGNQYNRNEETGVVTSTPGNGKTGGGVHVQGGSTFTMNDGEISNNVADEGGGVFVGYAESKPSDASHTVTISGDVRDTSTFTMTGGNISKNVAQYGEGGGIYIRSNTTKEENGSEISGGNILGNATLSKTDLGGGGIYIEAKTNLTIKNAVIRNNTAEGLGGGIGACVHGITMISVADGAIIYGNSANGSANSSGYPVGKYGNLVDGYPIWKDDDNFKNAAQDIFAASTNPNSQASILVSNDSINDFNPGWTGRGYALVDKSQAGAVEVYIKGNGTFYVKPVDLSVNEEGKMVIDSNRALALSAQTPTEEDLKIIEAFLQATEGRVLIEDNYSATHAGGIGNNGELNIGTKSSNRFNAIQETPTMDAQKDVH